jgi:hypothetical protein
LSAVPASRKRYVGRTLFRFDHPNAATLSRSRAKVYADVQALVSELRDQGPIFGEPRIDALVNYLRGYEAALRGVPLEGFQQWLELRTNSEGAPRHWAVGLPIAAQEMAGRRGDPERVYRCACDILSRFCAYRRRYGTKRVVSEYMRKRSKQLRLK